MMRPQIKSFSMTIVSQPVPVNVFLPKTRGFFHFDTMQSHELLREVFQKCSAKQVAAELGLSLSTIYKWAEPDDGTGSGTANPLDRIEALLRCTDDRRLVQWICQRSGGFFILNPKTNKPHPSYLIPATNEIVQEFADLLAVIATAAADNQITAKEATAIRERWEELKSVTESFVACCEGGNFSAFKEKHASIATARQTTL
jgi:transcriptional regulator with XRE-family HTH domain